MREIERLVACGDDIVQREIDETLGGFLDNVPQWLRDTLLVLIGSSAAVGVGDVVFTQDVHLDPIRATLLSVGVLSTGMLALLRKGLFSTLDENTYFEWIEKRLGKTPESRETY